jgi:type II secretory pathway component PulJ
MMVLYYVPGFNFDKAFGLAAETNRQHRIVQNERRRQNEIDRHALEVEARNQRAAVQTKRHKKTKIHAQAPKDVPAFLKNLTKNIKD